MVRSPLVRMLLGVSLVTLIIALGARSRANVIQALPLDPVAPEWVNFFSDNSTFFGAPVSEGAVIGAFDLDGVQCGEATVAVAGQYGVMPCYRDDETTEEDEGADPGDVISFSINGLPATPVPISLNYTPVAPSTTITWTSHGDLWEVDLRVVRSISGVVQECGGDADPTGGQVCLLDGQGNQVACDTVADDDTYTIAT